MFYKKNLSDLIMLSVSQLTTSGKQPLVEMEKHRRHWQLIRSKLGFYFSSGITLDIDVFFFGALPIDQSKIKHTKKLKEIPSRHFLENLPEKASMYAFIHLKLISNLQGFCQYIMADMLNLTIADYRKYSGIIFLGP